MTSNSYHYIKEFELEWNENLKMFVDSIGLTRILHGRTNDPETIVFKKCIDIFHRRAITEITSENSKLRTYGIFKNEVREEPYLRIVKNVKDRISMSKFRLSNHKLMIEKGRHRNLDKTMRICPFCSAVEDEIHFLLKCKPFRFLRADLLSNVESALNIRNLRQTDDRALFKLLMENENISKMIAKYLTKSLDLREFLIEKHRQLD